MSTHPGCVLTRVTNPRYLNQNIVPFAPPSSRVRLTSTATFGHVCFLSEPMRIRDLTYAQIRTNDSIVVTYVLLNIGSCLRLVPILDLPLRVYP
jgi:hypothetical protein